MTATPRRLSSALGVGVLPVGLSSVSVIAFPHAWFAALPWLGGACLALTSLELQATEKTWMVGVGVVPVVAAVTYPTGPGQLVLIFPAMVALVVHARLAHRRSIDRDLGPGQAGHDRSEAQSVEIVLALFLGVTACVAVAATCWLFGQLAGGAGSQVWPVATGTLGIGAGLVIVVRQLRHARRDGL